MSSSSRCRACARVIWIAVVLATAAYAAPSAAQPLGPSARLEGTWRVVATFVDPADLPPVELLLSFAAGRSADEGVLMDTNAAQLVPNPVCTPDQGVWRRTRRREFVATHYNYCFDAAAEYAPAGPTKIRDRILLSADGTRLAGEQYIEGFDTSGTLVFVARARLAGTRLEAEAPPAP
jgi:hypothetical protein